MATGTKRARPPDQRGDCAKRRRARIVQRVAPTKAAGRQTRSSISSPAPPPATDEQASPRRTNMSIISKLSSICSLPALRREIQCTAVVLKQVQLEAWHIANLHVRRLLNEHADPPSLNQTFFYGCCTGVLGNAPSNKYVGLLTTCQEYWRGRGSVVAYQAPSLRYFGSTINEVAKMMAINTNSMLALNFRRRLHQFIRFKYAPQGRHQLSYRATKRLVDSCYRVKTAMQYDSSGIETGRTIKLWNVWDETSDPTEMELREWLGVVPWRRDIRDNSVHFVKKTADMLTALEVVKARLDAGNAPPRLKRGTKAYSLLPTGNSFTADYIKINATTLFDLFSRLRLHDPTGIALYLATTFNMAPTRQCEDDQIPFSRAMFQRHRSMIMRAVFKVEQIETINHKFADEVSSNEYGATVCMTRPRSALEAEKSRKDVPEEVLSRDPFAKEIAKLPPDYHPETLIGIDPGVRALATAVTVGHHQRKLKHGGRRRRRLNRRARRRLRQHNGPARHGRRLKPTSRRVRNARRKQALHGRVLSSISTGEYHHLARANDFRCWHNNFKKREPWYARVLQAMPSFKTADYGTYRNRLDYVWQHLGFLMAFSTERSFLQWRFTRAQHQMATLTALATRLVPKPNKNVRIGFGDWYRQDGIKGHAHAPIKRFVWELKKRATVLPIDEFRTSVTCSGCHQQLKQARLLTKVKLAENEVINLDKSNLSRKEAMEMRAMRGMSSRKLANEKIVLKCTRNVLRCSNSECKANFWDRDVNASINILELLRSGLKGKYGERRLRPFKRGQAT